jgi:hypothetical protein
MQYPSFGQHDSQPHVPHAQAVTMIGSICAPGFALKVVTHTSDPNRGEPKIYSP